MAIIINEQTDRYTYESVFPVSIAETDCNGRVKLPVILNYMQDIAEKSINKYDEKLSCESLLNNGFGWFLIRYRVEFDRDLKNIKELKVKTESRGSQRLNAYRDFEVFDNVAGERVLRAASSWMIVDLGSKSLVNISKDFPELFTFDGREDDLSLKKLKSLESVDNEKSFSVRFDDLDVNNHVNNTVYVSWALEALDFEFRKNSVIKSLDIYYKHEAKYGDDIISQVRYTNENTVSEHVIKNCATGDELCLLRLEYV
ncbi:MAG: thioesterase [Muribaculaceae bacterium]|nr:thioesterase [Muribaculaceae bacterium]